MDPNGDRARCPRCGDALPPVFAAARIMDCPSCGTTVYLDGPVLRSAGSAGEMHDAPGLVALGRPVLLEGERFEPVGHARFSYGRGWWDEFWALDASGRGAWVSVDEGDVALQWPIAPEEAPALRRVPERGEAIDGWRVAEVETARCLAIRGALPERLLVGETYRYANLEDDEGAILSAEFAPSGEVAFALGRWLDAYAVRPA